MIFQLVTPVGGLEEIKTSDLVVTSPDALPLSYRRLVEAKATNLQSATK